MASDPDAAALLRQMCELYANCSSSRDQGQVVTKMVSERIAERTERKPFATHFVRPDRFRFEFRARVGASENFASRFVVWRLDGVCGTHWSIGEDREERSLRLALAGATGVSGGSAHTVPSLLIPKEIGPAFLGSLKNAVATESDLLGTSCLLIRGTTKAGETNVYVDRRTMLIRGIREARDFTVQAQDQMHRESKEALRAYAEQYPEEAARLNLGSIEFRPKPVPFSTDTLTTYTPEVDVDIDPEVFRSPRDERWLTP